MPKIIVAIALAIALLFVSTNSVSALVACPDNNPDCISRGSYLGPTDDMNVAQQDETINIIFPAVGAFVVITAAVIGYVYYKKK